ncbi:MAG: substrate-binding domain-containing protein [Polyangiales bacterium]
MTRSESSTVKRLREARGLSQLALADAVEVSRQSLSAIEAGRSDPSVSLAMRIAHVLECTVEDLFGDAGPGPRFEAVLAERAGLTPSSERAQRVALTFVRERWVAHPLASDELSAADALQLPSGRADSSRRGRVQLDPLRPPNEARETVVLLGCAPALGLLANRLNARVGPGRFLWLNHSSRTALALLKRELGLVAGVHFGAAPGPAGNLSVVQRELPGDQVSLFTVARWQSGILIRAGNTLGVRSLADLVRPGLRIAAREPGAATRQLFEEQLQSAHVPHKRLLRGLLELRGHLDVAQAVQLGAADVGIAMQPAAIAQGLHFIPIGEERFDLVVPRDSTQDRRIVRMLEILNSTTFQRELDAIGGYDASECGHSVS